MQRYTGRDKEFDRHIPLYTASQELASVNSGNAKKTYQSKAEGFLQEASTWLHKNMMRAFEIVYRGTWKPLIEWIRGKQPSSDLDSLRDAVNSAASVILEEYFNSLAPKYPQFSLLLTRENRLQAVREALRGIIGSTMKKQSRAVLDGLELLEGESLVPSYSPYAREVIDLLASGDAGDKVVNRGDLISDVQTRLRERVEELLLIQRTLDEGFRFWTSPLFEEDERAEYRWEYLRLHKRVRLAASGDKKKKNLLHDVRCSPPESYPV